MDTRGHEAHIAGLLYDGVLMPTAWHDALDRMCQRLGAGVFHYFTLDTSHARVPDSVGNVESFGLRDEMMLEYEVHHAGNDVRMAAAMRMAAGQLMLDHEQLSRQELSRNAVYADWLVPLGLRYTMATTTRLEGSARDFLSFMRPRDSAPYGPEEKAFFQHLMPDLQRAASLRARTSHLSHQAALGLSALDAMAQGIVVVDEMGFIQYANSAAERLLTAPSPLGSLHGRLHSHNAAAHARLMHMVVGVCTHQAQSAGTFQCDEGAERLVVTVLPLRPHHAALAVLKQTPMALVVMANPRAPAMLATSQVSDFLNLTPSEARLALLLVAGKTVKDFALIEGCSWHTARTHAKNLLRKTGCHRQAELVQLLQSLRLG